MTRDEIEKISAVEPYCFETDREERWYEIGCIDGLKAADAEPNLESLWHDASEEPEDDCKQILYQEKIGTYGIIVKHDWDLVNISWEDFSSANLMSRWAYISDLLPKGGEK